MEKGACVPLRVHTVVISVQHSEDITLDEMKKQLREKVIKVSGRGQQFVGVATVAYGGNLANTPVMSTYVLIGYQWTCSLCRFMGSCLDSDVASWAGPLICSLVGRSPMSLSGPLWSQPIA